MYFGNGMVPNFGEKVFIYFITFTILYYLFVLTFKIGYIVSQNWDITDTVLQNIWKTYSSEGTKLSL